MMGAHIQLDLPLPDHPHPSIILLMKDPYIRDNKILTHGL